MPEGATLGQPLREVRARMGAEGQEAGPRGLPLMQIALLGIHHGSLRREPKGRLARISESFRQPYPARNLLADLIGRLGVAVDYSRFR